VIEIHDLYKYYGDRRAVGPLSFTIEAGEVVGLLGLNGAGKTTTLRILACDLLPSSGQVRVDGLDVVDHPHEVRARIGYLPDRPPLYDEMTVRAFLLFAARLRGMAPDDAARRVPEVIETAELQDVAADLIGSLSHGFKQRVGIAQAIIHKPRLLVLDEPISGLDPVQIVEMRSLLRGLKGEHTILLSSHILSEISETCDRILVIRDGEIGAQGTADELSKRLLQGVRFTITARGDAKEALDVARGVDGVSSAEPASGVDAKGETTLEIEAERDIRAELCAALVQRGLGILELRRGERELESVFLRLAASEEQRAGRTARKKKKRMEAGEAPEKPAKSEGEAT
jgi:ABC-2 type transport system ATP-binding protein